MAKIIVSSPLKRFFGNKEEITIHGETIGDVINSLVVIYPEIRNKLIRGNSLSKQTVISVDNRDIRLLDNEKTPVCNSSVIHLLPALVGG